MKRTARIFAAAAFAACVLLSSIGCWFNREARTAKLEEQERLRLANVYGTWVSPMGYVMVFLADKGTATLSNRLIGAIPGDIHGRILLREPGKDTKWKPGVYKIVGRRILARSSNQETWAIAMNCDLDRGRLSMPGGDGRDVELFRSGQAIQADIDQAMLDELFNY
jgi:hypothetical protein